jgi:hypothetical protein
MQSYTKELSGCAVVFASLFRGYGVVRSVMLRSSLVEGEEIVLLGWYGTG